MALRWHATGPMLIQISRVAGDMSYVNFARTDNEDLCKFEIEDLYRDFTRNDLGDMTAESVATGSTCFIRFSATFWDESVWQQVMNITRLNATSGTEGTHAVVGSLLRTIPSGGSRNRLFGLGIVTTTVGEKSYYFDYCRIAGPHRVEEFGNTMKKLMPVIEALPDESGNFYRVATNS